MSPSHQDLDLRDGELFAYRRQVQIECGRLQRAVAHVLLDLAQVHAALQEMSGVAVTQCMRRDASFTPPQLSDRLLDAALNGRGINRLSGGRGLLMVAAFTWEEPLRVPMSGPMGALSAQRVGWERHEAVFMSLAATNVDHHALRFDIFNL